MDRRDRIYHRIRPLIDLALIPLGARGFQLPSSGKSSLALWPSGSDGILNFKSTDPSRKLNLDLFLLDDFRSL